LTGRGRGGAARATLALALVALPGAAAERPAGWGQAQSFLEELDGAPLLAAEWTGRFRPYRFDGTRCVPLVAVAAEAELAAVDLFSPTPAGAGELMLVGTESGRPEHDLYRLDVASGRVAALTSTPGLDEGSFCVERGSGLVAYRADAGERFARLAGGQLRPLAGAAPPFERCRWLDGRTLVGAAGQLGAWRLHRCAVAGESVDCRPTRAFSSLRDFSDFTRLPDGRLAAIGLARAESRRRAHPLAPDLSALARPASAPAESDELEWAGAVARVGAGGRYRASVAPDSDATVFRLRALGEALFGIVGDARTPRTLARLEGGGWRFLCTAGAPAVADAPAPVELEIVDPGGRRHPALRFGPERADSIVLWLHGGPRENVSPRFNPYFHHLNRSGWSVVALNYPGSTGWGWEYERLHVDDEAAVAALAATLARLEADGARRVVAWSVSAGSRLLRLIVDRGLAVEGLVDQVGFGNADLVERVRARRIPYFAIRGRHDRNGPRAHADFWYEGGHDVTRPEQFAALLAAVRPFLDALPRRADPLSSPATSGGAP
jgi:hypothetical protein